MRVRVKIDQDNFNVDEVFSGASADEVVGQVKAFVAKKLNFAMRIALNAMSNVSFAQEVVKRLNQAKKLNLPLPNSCAEFIQQAQQQGYATIEDQ